MSVFAQEAERLISLGYHIFQCQPRSKDPFATTAPNGCNSASGDVETIRRWWAEHPDCNIGLKCDNLLVIDVDNKNGKDGNGDFDKVMKRLGPVTVGPVSKSGEKGFHLLFQKPKVDIKGVKGVKWEGRKTSIDIQIGNQYIVAPPSIHPTTGLEYAWRNPLCHVDELPALPDTWIEYFLPHRQRKDAGPQLVLPHRCNNSLPLVAGVNERNNTKLILPKSYGAISPVERCQEYLRKVDPCIAGQGGDTQLFKAASVIFWDFGLSESEGMPLFEAYNATCQPPWPHNRLEYKMQQALNSANHTKPRGHLLEQERSPIKETADISRIIVQATPQIDDEPDEDELYQIDAIDDPGHVPESLLRIPGFVGEVMDFSLEGAPYPAPTAAFCGAMTLQSFLCGRKVREPGDLRTNLYLLALLGASGGKDYPRKINTHILYVIGEERSLGEKFVSGEGLQDSLQMTPNMLFQNDEIDGLIYSLNDKNRGSHIENIMGTLLTLYTSASVIYPMRRKSGKEHPGVIDQPHLTIFGTATPQYYYAALSERMMSNGFFARMVIVDADKRSLSQDPKPVDTISDRIIETARWWKAFQPGDSKGNLANFHPKPITIPFEDNATKFMRDFRHYADLEYSKAEDRDDVVAMTVWGRANENARKLALLYACSEDHQKPVISLSAGRWASEFVSHQIKRQLYKVKEFHAKTRFQALCKDAVRQIRQWHRSYGKQGMPRWKLKRQLGLTPREFEDLMVELDAQRYVKLERISTSGRPKETISLLKF